MINNHSLFQLLSLKAEILKKHQELAKVKSENEKKINIIKKSTPLEFKNKAHMNDNKQQTGETEAENEECQGLLKKSRYLIYQSSTFFTYFSKQINFRTKICTL